MGRTDALTVHIGSGKTGSSSIQSFLRDNRERLADLGYLYPRTPGRARHIRLGLFLKSEAELEESILWHRQKWSDPTRFRQQFRSRLLREVDQSGLPCVLLSDESLYDQADDPALRRLRRLTDRLAEHLRLVVYLRRQDDHLISRYQQRVKNAREVRRLREWARQDMSALYDYDARLRAWERLMSPDEFVVRVFERERFADGSLFQDFLDAAGIDVRAEDLEQVPHHNESLDAESVEFLRLLTLYRVENDGATLGLIDSRSAVTRLAEASPAEPVLTLPAPVLDEFMARWDEGNRRVARDYLGDERGQLFHSARKTRNTTTSQYLDPGRLDHFLTLIELPEESHEPLRRIAEREASAL